MKRVLYEDLETALRTREAKVSVLGQGYIGLPTSLLIARAGFTVYGFDVNEELIRDLSRGNTRLEGERRIPELLRDLRGRNYFPTSDLDDLYGSDVVLIAVPTPKGKDRPNLSMLVSALETALRVIRKGGLVIIESTLPPRTFQDLILPLVESRGIKGGRDVYLAYCPERALPGKLILELTQNFRIIGAVDERSGRLARILYESFVEGDIEVVDPLTAEMVKLVENSYRDVNIAFANEVARMCETLGVDVRKVRELANKHPRVNMLIPGIGVGGSCLTKDPWFLYWTSRERGYTPNLIRESRRINSGMPFHYAEVLDELVRRLRGGRGTIAVLGLTYKGDVPDPRESPVEPLVKELIKRGHTVRTYDPLIDSSFGGERASDILEAVRGADVLAFTADHSEFRMLDLRKLRRAVGRDGPVILFDGRLLFDPEEAEEAGFLYVSVGRPYSVLDSSLVTVEG